MSFKLSTGMRNHMLVTGSVKSALDGGVIRIYEGTEPSGADDAIGSATLLVTISVDGGGTGLTIDGTASGGIAQKSSSQTWEGTCVAGGTASWFRFSGTADAGGASTTEKRLQGTVGTALADLLVASTAFTAGAVRQIDSFNVAMPTN